MLVSWRGNLLSNVIFADITLMAVTFQEPALRCQSSDQQAVLLDLLSTFKEVLVSRERWWFGINQAHLV